MSIIVILKQRVNYLQYIHAELIITIQGFRWNHYVQLDYFLRYANLNPSTTNKGDQGAQKGIAINQIKTLYTIKINQSYYDKSLYTRIWASVQPIKATKRLREGITIKINHYVQFNYANFNKSLYTINHYIQESEPQYNQ